MPRIRIENVTAEDSHSFFVVGETSYRTVIEWYAGYCAGDDYSIWLNDEPMDLDHNGIPIYRPIDGIPSYPEETH